MSKKREVVINACFGGFGLSYKGVMRYAELKGIELYGYDIAFPRGEDDKYKYTLLNGTEERMFCTHYNTNPNLEVEGNKSDDGYFSDRDIKRDDRYLVQTVRELKAEASGRCAQLRIVKIPSDVEYEIDEYDGNEHIAEKHRTWS